MSKVKFLFSKNEFSIIIQDYLRNISKMPMSSDFLKDEKSSIKIKTLYSMISDHYNKTKMFSTEKEIEEYFDFIVDTIEDLNRYFAKIKRTRKRLFTVGRAFLGMSINSKYFNAFLVDKGMSMNPSKKRIEEKTNLLAGFEHKKDSSESLNTEDTGINVQYGPYEYGLIYSEDSCMFFFSSEASKMAVQLDNGKIIPYSQYVSNNKKNRKPYIKKSQIYKALKEEMITPIINSFINNYRKTKLVNSREKK